MRCKKFKENIVLDLYAELGEREKAELEKHLTECTACAKDYAYSKNVFQAIQEADTEDIPEPEWGVSWGQISSAIQQKAPRRQKSFRFAPKWAYAAAAVLLVFVLGIVTGQLWLPQKQDKGLTASTSQEYIQQILSRHLEELKPVLVQMANYTVEKNGNGTILVDKEALQSLIIQNILLKSLISGQHPTAEQILEDVELVLRGLANMEEGDSRTKSMVKDLIDEREILLNMNILQKM
ncbi:MAG: zf-HC2 domain-containing protein [Candidatus Aminicenantes bacterium]|jgi:hypothetical protein